MHDPGSCKKRNCLAVIYQSEKMISVFSLGKIGIQIITITIFMVYIYTIYAKFIYEIYYINTFGTPSKIFLSL